MTSPSWSVFAVRPRRMALALAVGLALMAGCKHHRSAYRPIFGAPSAVVVPEPPCATGDCGGAVTPGFSSPSTVTPPAAPLGPESLEPITPAGGGAAEPGLEGASSGTRYRPRLEPPKASYNAESRHGAHPRPAVGTGRRVLLRRNVQAFVDDAQDLFMPPRADRPWRYVVLHHSAHAKGGLAQLDRDHRERLGTAGCGYHFVVGNGSESPDGQIEVAPRWSEQKAGAHCRDSQVVDANDYGIGICLVGDLDSVPPTPRQVEAARALVAYLQDRYAIPAENIRVHGNVARTATTCPGRHFPAEAILGELDLSLASR